MSINPLLNEQGTEPLRSDNEYFILRRRDISYKLTSDINGQHEGEGNIFLTSKRLVLIPTKHSSSFKAVEFPLNLFYDESFKQPFFGKNYLIAKSYPIFASPLGNLTIQIWFRNSHSGTFINALFTLLDSLRNNDNKNHDEKILTALKNNNITEYFAIDPDDPSDVYQIQPESVNIPKQNYQSVVVNRPPAMGISNNINSEVQNEQQLKYKNDLYMSQFIYKNPNPNNKFVYQDPGFTYKNPNQNVNNLNNNKEDDDDDLVSPYNPPQQNQNNNFNRNITYVNYNPYAMSNVVMNNNFPAQQLYPPQNYVYHNNIINPNNYINQNNNVVNPNVQVMNKVNNINKNSQNNNVANPYAQIMSSMDDNNYQNNNQNKNSKIKNVIKKSEGYGKLREEDESYNADLSSRNMLNDNLKDGENNGLGLNNMKDQTNYNESLLNSQNSNNNDNNIKNPYV